MVQDDPVISGDTYAPVPCIFHERLEFAVLRGIRLDLGWIDASGAARRGIVMPTDVRTRDGAEWLSLRRDDGQAETVRLDRITSMTEVASVTGTSP